MSTSEPLVSSKAARVSAYASTTHCRSAKDACSDVWMSGNATFTIVMSSNNMNVPRQTATSVHHLFGSRFCTRAPADARPLLEIVVMTFGALHSGKIGGEGRRSRGASRIQLLKSQRH